MAAPTNLALVQGTTQQPSVPFSDPVRAERADIYDVGVVQQVLPGLVTGVDGYYKRATNLIDGGQFGQAFILTAFNCAKGRMSASSCPPKTSAAACGPTPIWPRRAS